MSSNKNIHPSQLKNYYVTRKYPNGWSFSLLPTITPSNETPLTVFITINDLPKYGYNIHQNNTTLSKSANIYNQKNRSISMNSKYNNYKEDKIDTNSSESLTGTDNILSDDRSQDNISSDLSIESEDKRSGSNTPDRIESSSIDSELEDFYSRAIIVPKGSKRSAMDDNWRKTPSSYTDNSFSTRFTSNKSHYNNEKYSRSAPD